MTTRRRYVLTGVLGALVLLAAYVLQSVFGTVFFAITVAVVFQPVLAQLEARGLSRYMASVASTAIVFVSAALIVLPLTVVLYLRRTVILEFLQSLPDHVTLSAFGYTYTIRAAEAQALLVDFVQNLVLQFLGSLPVLAFKAALFVFVVFALFAGSDRVQRALVATVPVGYRDVPRALGRRARETLFAIYILQAATAFGTFLVAVPIFWLLGYDYYVTLAIAAGVLQFLPVVGPSVLVIAVAAVEVAVGNVVAAALVAGFGLVFIAYLPDVLIRPRLAERTADMPGSLYFVGFIGGLLSLGAIGIIAGPLVVSLVSEGMRLLASENAIVDE